MESLTHPCPPTARSKGSGARFRTGSARAGSRAVGARAMRGSRTAGGAGWRGATLPDAASDACSSTAVRVVQGAQVDEVEAKRRCACSLEVALRADHVWRIVCKRGTTDGAAPASAVGARARRPAACEHEQGRAQRRTGRQRSGKCTPQWLEESLPRASYGEQESAETGRVQGRALCARIIETVGG